MESRSTRIQCELSAGEAPENRPRLLSRYSSADGASVRLPEQLTERLRIFAQQQGMPLIAALLSGWAVLLGRWSAQEAVVGVRAVSRRRTENEPPIDAFENAAALQLRLQEESTIEQLLKKVRAAVAEAYAHQNARSTNVPNVARDHDQASQQLIGLHEAPAAIIVSTGLELPSLKLSQPLNQSSEIQLEWELSLRENEQRPAGIGPTRNQGERETVERIAACWQVVLEGMVVDVQRPISQLPVLTAVEREQVLSGFNDTAVARPQDRLIHELFEEQVRRTPDAVALIYERQSLSYAELNSRANQLARYLRDKGVGPDQLVGICIERSPEMVVGLLGILKAGGACVPLDPSYPAERLAYMLKDSAPRLLLTQEQLRRTLPTTPSDVIAMDSCSGEITRREDANLDLRSPQLTSRHLAYVIYTSGSTGEPKGVAAEHRGTVNRIVAQEAIGAFTSDDICCQKTSIGFVDAIFEILGPLSYGRPLVLASAAVAKNVQQLASLIERERITRLVTVPSLAQSLLESVRSAQALQSLRNWTLSGEELKGDLLRKLHEELPKCTFTNLYGSSEVAADVTYYVSRNCEGFTAPIGRPIENTQIYILDCHRQPVPIGVAGEIYVGGAGVARGYLNRPELTAERFIADPFGQNPRARLYKTGDKGRWRGDGTIEYLGRNDEQVKIRGFRIEVGEIEAQLARHSQVKEAAVIVREDGRGQRLLAYVTQRDEIPPSSEDLRAHLKALLPEYMVPSAFVILECFPQTPSGKLDRRALPMPETGAYVSRPYEAPQGEVEDLLVGIWEDLLPVAPIGRQDNFFELGGHSLLIAQMVERLGRLGFSIDVRCVFESPTLAAVASALTREAVVRFEAPPNLIPPECEKITPEMLPLVQLEPEQIERIVQSAAGGAANIQDIYPLAPLQEGLLFHHLLDHQGGDTYVRPMLLSLSSREQLERLIAALQCVIDRHDILRTAVLWEQLPRPVQVVYRRVALSVEEIVLDLHRDPIEQLKERMRPGNQRIDLRQAPLMHLQAAADAQGVQWYAVLYTHHLVCDNESLNTLLAEVTAYCEGRGQELAESSPYRNHVAQALAHAQTHDAEAFFRRKLGEIDEPTAPFGLLDVHGDGSRVEEVHQSLDPRLAKRIRAEARRLGVSAATLFHAGWALVVSQTSRRDDVVYGTVLLGRLQGSVGAQRILGMSINTLPLRLRLKDLTVRELVERTQRELVELLIHEQAPLAVAQRCSSIAGSAPPFSALLNYLHSTPNSETRHPRIAPGIQVLASREWTNYPIVLSVDDQGQDFWLTVQTDRRIEPHRVLEYTVTAMRSLVEALERAPATPATMLSILPGNEQHQVIELFNATRSDYPWEKLIHELFEEQVQRIPDAIAVVYEDQWLTYAELNVRANQLAHYLRDQGVQIGEYIPIVMPRCLRMLIAQLAVLKSGGVYVPVDPTLPVERQAFMVQDCGARRILAEQQMRAGLGQESIQWIDCAETEAVVGNLPASDLKLQMPARTSAYVMYTSGSTGVPKGVIVPHHAVNRLVINNGYALLLPTDCIAHCSNPAFDASTFEIWGALLNGGRVLIVPQEVVLEARQFAEVIREQRVTVLWLTVGLFAQYTEALATVFGQLRYLITGGDIVEPGMIRRVLCNSPPKHLLSAYGPTECTTFSTTCLIEAVDEEAKSIPIGRPISNARIYILDSRLRPAPIGVAGEMYIGGAGVALGYLNRPELTAERFISDPFSTDLDARLYRSGDLARWRADGSIDFLGRDDQQVKLRGFRIELGEIETQLARHDRVREAVVIVREDVSGEKRLTAYIRTRGEGDLIVEELRTHLSAILPEYMVPGAFVIMECFPLTSSGKLNRRALPAPELGAYLSRQYEAPQGEVEEILAGIWQELLRVQRVGREDNFFELGGNSLMAMQVAVRIQSSFATEMPIRMLFEFPTVKQLSARLDNLRQADLLADAASGRDDMEELLEQVASMPASDVEELVRELRGRART